MGSKKRDCRASFTRYPLHATRFCDTTGQTGDTFFVAGGENGGSGRRVVRGDGSRGLAVAGLLAVLLLAVGTGCSTFKTPSEDAIATVDGVEIKVKDFTVKLRNALNLLGSTSGLKEEDIVNVKREALDDLIDEKVMLVQAEKLGLKVTDEELKIRVEEIKKDYAGESFAQVFGGEKVDYKIWSEELRKRLLLEKLVDREVNSKITVTDDEAMAYYQANRSRYYSEETVHVAQIVVATKEKADAVLKRLQAGEEFRRRPARSRRAPKLPRGGTSVFSPGGHAGGLRPDRLLARRGKDEQGREKPLRVPPVQGPEKREGAMDRICRSEGEDQVGPREGQGGTGLPEMAGCAQVGCENPHQ